MSEKQWLKSYPDFVKPEINLDGYNSIVDIFDEGVRKFGNQVAYKNMDVEMTFNELNDHVNALAWYLQNNTNLQKFY